MLEVSNLEVSYGSIRALHGAQPMGDDDQRALVPGQQPVDRAFDQSF